MPSSAQKGDATRSPENDATTNNIIDATSDEMMAKKRSFTQKLAIKRQIYHEMTSFRKFPLQEMAIRDVEENLKDYLGTAITSDNHGVTAAQSDSDDSDDGHQRYDAVAAPAVITPTSSTPRTSQVENNLREQFTNEFLREKSMPVVTMTNNELLQPDIIGVDGDLPTLTQEMANCLPFLDAAIERHCGGCETDSNSGSTDSSRSDEYNAEKCSTRDSEENSVGTNAGQSGVTFEESNDSQQTDNDLRTGAVFIFDEEEEEEEEEEVSKDVQNASQMPTLWSFEPRLFAMETALHGKRRYVSAHLGRFMDHYWRECDVHSRHYYELIRESTPCRLYFDLEFNKRYNPHLTEVLTESLLTELFDEICHQFQLLYSISIKRSDMVDLDSSTDKKFSRHWILHLPGGLLFDDARAAGIFVKMMVSRLEKERSGELQSKGRALLADNLFVNAEEATDEKDEPKMSCIIDIGVYTRNRLFRLLGSKKFGKTCDATLRIAKANEFTFPKQFVETYLAADSRERGHDISSFEKFCHSLCFEAHAEALSSTLVVPANSTKVKFPTLPHPADFLNDEEQAQLCITPRFGGIGGGGVFNAQRATPEYGRSPFPKLDHFIINTLGKREGLVGSIGTWTLDYLRQPLPQLICYNMRDNRFCENVARAHKSNNIIWNVHLIDRVCFQTCHDPECRAARFRGEALDLPEDVNTEIDEYFLEHELSKLNEDVVIGGNNDLPKKLSGEEKSDDFDDPELEQAMLQLNIEEKQSDSVHKDDSVAPLNVTVESADPWVDDDELDSELLKIAENLPQVFSC